MNRLFGRMTVLLVLVLFSGGGLVYLLSLDDPPGFTVIKSHGTSGIVGGTTLIPGEPVRTGDRVRVGSSSLVLAFGDPPLLRVRFAPGSRFEHAGRPAGGRSLALRVMEGSGEAELTRGRLILSGRRRDFLAEFGTFRWSVRSGEVQFLKTPQARLFVLDDGETRPLVTDSPTVSIPGSRRSTRGWPSSPHPMPGYAQQSTLSPGNAVIEALFRHAEGDPPDSILDVFGHWVRDRWGNVYLYEGTEDEIRLRSAGPDEALFTRDDRSWERRPTP